jgi:hypothetical protein
MVGWGYPGRLIIYRVWLYALHFLFLKIKIPFCCFPLWFSDFLKPYALIHFFFYLLCVYLRFFFFVMTIGLMQYIYSCNCLFEAVKNLILVTCKIALILLLYSTICCWCHGLHLLHSVSIDNLLQLSLFFIFYF